VDLWLVHTPTQHEGRLQEVWKQCEEVQKEGLAKNIGVSNFRIKDFEEILKGAEIIPQINQVRLKKFVILLILEYYPARLNSIPTYTRPQSLSLNIKRNTALRPNLTEVSFPSITSLMAHFLQSSKK